MSPIKTLALSLLAAASCAYAQPASAPAGAAPAAAPAAATAAPATAAPSATAASEGEAKIAYYGRKFAGRKTASGERFNPQALTMAHKTLPFGTRVKVTNLANKRSVVVRVNDRGPSTPDRAGDVSLAAAHRLGMVRAGLANARLEVVGEAKKAAKKA